MTLTTNRKLAIFIGAFFAGLLVGDSLVIFLGTCAFLLFGGFLVGIIMFGYFLSMLFNTKKTRFPTTALFHWILVFVTIVSFMLGGSIKANWSDSKFQNFVEETVLELREVKSMDERFPGKLPSSIAARMPDGLSYESNGKTYSFSYSP